MDEQLSIEYRLSQLPDDLLITKIKYSLALIGMSESYFSFNYLVEILLRLFKFPTRSDEQVFKEAVEMLAKEYSIVPRTIRYELTKILNSCTNTAITTKTQFNLKNNAIINKIRIIKDYLKEKVL